MCDTLWSAMLPPCTNAIWMWQGVRYSFASYLS